MSQIYQPFNKIHLPNVSYYSFTGNVLTNYWNLHPTW